MTARIFSQFLFSSLRDGRGCSFSRMNEGIVLLTAEASSSWTPLPRLQQRISSMARDRAFPAARHYRRALWMSPTTTLLPWCLLPQRKHFGKRDGRWNLALSPSLSLCPESECHDTLNKTGRIIALHNSPAHHEMTQMINEPATEDKSVQHTTTLIPRTEQCTGGAMGHENGGIHDWSRPGRGSACVKFSVTDVRKPSNIAKTMGSLSLHRRRGWA